MTNFNLNESIDNTTLFSIDENHSFIHVLSSILLFVMIIGLIGNLLVIYVVCNYKRLKTVTNTYLLHLALSDLIFLSGIPFLVSSILTRSWRFGRLICKLFFLSQGVNQYTSILILALLSFDRFLAVCHSTKSIWWRSRVHPHLLLILTWIFSFVLMLPIVIFTTLQPSGPSTVQCIIILPLSHSRLPYLIFVVYTSMITFILPLTFMIFFYLKVVHRLQNRVNKQHRRSRTSTKTRRRVTILVLTVITIHLVCCSPYWTFQLITTAGLVSQTSSILIPLSSISQLLLFVNSAVNPLLYAFISEVFRHSFKRVFHCCCEIDENEIDENKTTHKRIALSTTQFSTFLPTRSTVGRLTFDSSNIRTSSLNIKKTSFALVDEQRLSLADLRLREVSNAEGLFV